MNKKLQSLHPFTDSLKGKIWLTNSTDIGQMIRQSHAGCCLIKTENSWWLCVLVSFSPLSGWQRLLKCHRCNVMLTLCNFYECFNSFNVLFLYTFIWKITLTFLYVFEANWTQILFHSRPRSVWLRFSISEILTQTHTTPHLMPHQKTHTHTHTHTLSLRSISLGLIDLWPTKRMMWGIRGRA